GASTRSGREYPKPPIWVSPSRVVALGGSVTIRCEGRYQGMEFFLHKAGNQNPQVQSVYFGTVAEFPIPSVGREDGGSYTCDYRPITAQNRSSYLSDPVEIIVGGEGGAWLSVPAPSPHPARPSGGLSMTVQCRGQHQGVQFVLNKERRHFPPVDSDRFEVVFPISNVRREHGGSYSCSYHSRSEPFAVSYPSDPMELVVRGEGPGSASPFPAPPPARPSWGLCANGMLLSNPPSLFSSAAGSRGWVGARVWFSQPCLLCADPNLPRPSISLSPTGVTAPGADVTIWCQGQYWYVRFFLHKAGDLNPQRHMDPAGDTAEFHIPNVGRQHGGNYSCSYRPRSEPFVSSQPSDPVELVVAGEGPSSTSPLPAPLSEGRHPQSHPFLPPLQGPAPIPPMALPHSVPPPLQPHNPFATFCLSHCGPKTGEALSPCPGPGVQQGVRAPPVRTLRRVWRLLPSWGRTGGTGAKVFLVPPNPVLLQGTRIGVLELLPACLPRGRGFWAPHLAGPLGTGPAGPVADPPLVAEGGGAISELVFQPLPPPRQMLVLFP
uniref:Ig-like domain-containing protein n=1 Tax=Chrysemys picta bellii TaxID=8478 RepID=A0A8C3HWP3_CHRPI